VAFYAKLKGAQADRTSSLSIVETRDAIQILHWLGGNKRMIFPIQISPNVPRPSPSPGPSDPWFEAQSEPSKIIRVDASAGNCADG
jgi:hypothetical protein